MKEVSIKHCDNCGKEICCNLYDIKNCSCSRIELSIKTRDFVAKTFFDCLCNNCLEQLDLKIVRAAEVSFPVKKEEFIEGVHYYREGNMWVFTELYHILKGSCCGNGCRHCVYGYEEVCRKAF